MTTPRKRQYRKLSAEAKEAMEAPAPTVEKVTIIKPKPAAKKSAKKFKKYKD